MQDDLIERLEDADRHSQQRVLGSRIFGEAADRIAALEADKARLMGLVKEAGEAVNTIIAHCEAMENEAYNNLGVDQPEHAQGYWRGQKSVAKSIRRHLADLSRATLAKIKETPDA